jgi:hypothetical protein
MYKRLLSNTRNNLKGHRGEKFRTLSMKMEFKCRTLKVKWRTDDNSIGRLLGTSSVLRKRGRQVFGSYFWRVQVLVFALWSGDYTHVSAVEASFISLTEKRVTPHSTPVRWCWHYSSIIVDLSWLTVYPWHHHQCRLLRWNPGALECYKDSETSRLSRGIIILRDSARLYSAVTTREKLHQFQWQDFSHPPTIKTCRTVTIICFGPM